MEEKSKLEKEAEDLFGEMRDATPEEMESINEYIKSISEDNSEGKNFFEMLKETTPTKEEVDKEKEDLDKQVEDLLNEKNTAEKNFKLEELSKEDETLLSKEEIDSYNLGRKLQLDEEKKEINLLEDLDSNLLFPDEIEVLKNGTPEEKTKMGDAIRAKYIINALTIAAKLEEEKFKVKANNIMKTTYPVAIVNQYFRLNAKRFEVTEESIKEDPNIENRAKAYYYTVGIKKILDLSKNPLFLSRLRKQCSDERYKRHVENIDFFIGKAIGNNPEARRSGVNSVKNLDYNIRQVFFKLFKMNIWGLDDKNNHAISRAYGYAVSEIAKRSDVRSADMIEIYFYNTNVAVLTMMGSVKAYKELTGDAKLFFDYLYDFINNIYTYFLEQG